MAGMSREEMRRRIEGGESVSWHGRILRDVRDLPAEEDVAESSTEKEQALARLESEHRDLGQRIERLRGEVGEARAREAERREADEQIRKLTGERDAAVAAAAASSTTTAPQTGAPLNPVTAHGPSAPAVRRQGPAVADPAKTTKGDDGKDADPVIAGRPLSFYRDHLDKSDASTKAAAKKVLSDLEGVGDATAEKILDALKEADADGGDDE